MRVVLLITDGPAEGRQIPIQSGERARFGSSSGADVSLPKDVELSGVHFELECQTECCLIRDMGSAGGTFVNGEPIKETPLASGDEIVAGLTKLYTTIQGGPQPVVPDAEFEGEPEQGLAALTVAELCELASLAEESLLLLKPSHTAEEFVEVLTQNDRFDDAIRVLTLYLPKTKTIFWAHRCVNEVTPRELDEDEQKALDAAKAYLSDPSEPNRCAAMAIAEQLDYDNAASCVAAAAGWSQGSMLAPEFDEVPPSPELTGKVAAAALTWTATGGDALTINDRYKEMLKIGREVLEGKSTFQEKAGSP